MVSPQNASLERATFVQLAYAMTRNETASPIVAGATFDWARSAMVDGLSINLDAQPLTMTSDLSLLTDARNARPYERGADVQRSSGRHTARREPHVARLDANRRSADG